MMDPMAEKLMKIREERLAREKARIEKLRELNLIKYNKPNEGVKNSVSSISLTTKSNKSETNFKPLGIVKNNFAVNGTTKRPITAPLFPKSQVKDNVKQNTFNQSKPAWNTNNNAKKTIKQIESNDDTVVSKTERKPLVEKVIEGPKTKLFPNKVSNKSVTERNFVKDNKKQVTSKVGAMAKILQPRKSIAPQKPNQTISKSSSFNNSVFERLYKPKMTQTKVPTDIEKLKNDPNYLKKVIRTTGLILNKRHTCFETKPKIEAPVRRSISAVHFKRISKQELSNCVHKWSSIGEKLNKQHLKEINEDESLQPQVFSAVKSEQKKVKFMTPLSSFNTPTPAELQARLKSWLEKRGKSMDSYHHLQCFGIHHLPHRKLSTKLYDDEDKENVAVESDSDNDSYTENMNEIAPVNKWRRASVTSDSIDFDDTQNTTATGASDNTEEILLGALVDLTELLKEGYDWEQCARWLRTIRERFPFAHNSAAYWECRAALEERRGDLPASVQCWEEAIAKGTEHSVVEANLDQLLDKFMQLKISPNSNKKHQVDPKLVDVKNVFKSTIIRFAVQQAKLRKSSGCSPTPKYCVTPVRRSGRLSAHWSGRDPRDLRHARDLAGPGTDLVFVPNGHLHEKPIVARWVDGIVKYVGNTLTKLEQETDEWMKRQEPVEIG